MICHTFIPHSYIRVVQTTTTPDVMSPMALEFSRSSWTRFITRRLTKGVGDTNRLFVALSSLLSWSRETVSGAERPHVCSSRGEDVVERSIAPGAPVAISRRAAISNRRLSSPANHHFHRARRGLPKRVRAKRTRKVSRRRVQPRALFRARDRRVSHSTLHD